jgi:hypothetical protein
MRSLACRVVLVASVAALSVAVGSAVGRASGQSHLRAAQDAIERAIGYEDVAARDAAEGKWDKYGIASIGGDGRAFTAFNSLGFAESDVTGALAAGEVDSATAHAIESQLREAQALDREAETAAYGHKAYTVRSRLEQADEKKQAALKSIKHLLASSAPATGDAAKNPQTPCSNQNAFDPQFPDYTQLHETCTQPVVGLRFGSSVPVQAAGWLGSVIVNCPVSGKTATCTGITTIPALQPGNIYLAHPGGFPHGDVASVTITFADGTTETEYFFNH